jgi:hypothetical protein
MINDNDILLLENYIGGMLSENELKAFEERLKDDSELQKELQQRKKIAELWKAADEYQKTKRQIKNIVDKKQKTHIGFYKKNFYIFGIAASVLLLFGIYWFLIKPHNNGANIKMAIANDTLILHQSKPEKYAGIEYTIKTVAPQNHQIFGKNETITFKWENNSNNTNIVLVIKDSAGLHTFLKQPLNSYDSKFTLNSGKLKPDKYQWYINDTLNRQYFTISK